MKRPTITTAQRLKVFEDHGAIVCCQEGDCDNAIYIKGCDIDHHLALVDGGKHETGNLRPICTACHAKKSAREHIGAIRSRGFDKTLRKRMSGRVERRT